MRGLPRGLVTVKVAVSTTVAELLEHLASKEDEPLGQVRLMVGKKQMSPERIVGDYVASE